MGIIKKKRINVSPPFVIAGSFLFLTWTDALFVATSATTVTGLSVFDPGTTLTVFGEMVLLTLVQCGGIGLMTFAVVLLILLGKKIGLQKTNLVF